MRSETTISVRMNDSLDDSMTEVISPDRDCIVYTSIVSGELKLIPKALNYGACRPVAQFERLNRIGLY